MPTVELNLSPKYVPHWGFVDGVRELFQNALDGQVANPENTMFWNYEPRGRLLTVGNKDSTLDRRTLMIGETSKSGKKEEIGKYGEGYKLAMLVLTRAGYKVRVRNYASRELWEPEIRLSAKLNCPVAVVRISKFIFKRPPDNNLVFEVHGVTEENMDLLKSFNLNIAPPDGEILTTPTGRILLDPKYKGNVYVSGLFICHNKDLTHGYDFDPKHIQLDRERRLVSDFELNWSTSKMWSELGRDHKDKILNLVAANSNDTRFINSMNVLTSVPLVSEHAYYTFSTTYGPAAYPVSTQFESELVTKVGMTPVVVPEQYKELLRGSGRIPTIYEIQQKHDKRVAPEARIRDLLKRHGKDMDCDLKVALLLMVTEAKKWKLQ